MEWPHGTSGLILPCIEIHVRTYVPIIKHMMSVLSPIIMFVNPATYTLLTKTKNSYVISHLYQYNYDNILKAESNYCNNKLTINYVT